MHKLIREYETFLGFNQINTDNAHLQVRKANIIA